MKTPIPGTREPKPFRRARVKNPLVSGPAMPAVKVSARRRQSLTFLTMDSSPAEAVASSPPARNGVRFTLRKVTSQQTLGECLAQRRAVLGASVAQIARQLNINASYLEALEHGRHDDLPGTVYATAFLKVYAGALGLDPPAAIRRYRSELKILQHSRGEAAAQWRPVRRAAWWHFLAPARILRTVGLAVVLVSALTYLGFKVEAIVQPPVLVVSSPADEILTANPLLMVDGQTEPGGLVTVNGLDVLTDEQGRFSAPFDLQAGVNLITIAAKKNHSNQTITVRRVVLQPAEDR